MTARTTVDVLVLNFNGCRLMADHLPSVMRAAKASVLDCRVHVIDNDSTDGSRAWLATNFPEVRIWSCANRGLCSFNEVLPRLDSAVAILLNNDISLEPDFVDPLVAPFLADGESYDAECFLSAPLCWQVDRRTCEGFRTAIQWRWGLVQATGQYAGHERHIFAPGLTASAGAALAADRRRFVELGGFDALYLPGRLEDLDFAFRGYQAGYHARYLPEAVCYHQPMSTFGTLFGQPGCDALALRNTLLFQWKNLRTFPHRVRQWFGAAIRVAADAALAAFVGRERRWRFVRAFAAAWKKRDALRQGPQSVVSGRRERDFFRRFHPRQIAASRLVEDLERFHQAFPPHLDIKRRPHARPTAKQLSGSSRP